MKTLSRILLLTILCGLLSLCALAADGETLYNAEYCFSESDFSTDSMPTLRGIFVTEVPDASVASVRLRGRIIRPGDVLPMEVLSDLRLSPACTQSCNAVFGYQPICGSALGKPTALTIRIQSGKNEAPKANDLQFETYKNIPNDGVLTACDPENAPMTFQLVDKPTRGTVKLKEDGSFVYTPDKNKVGEDAFTFTATDEAGNVSNPGTVRIKILKPTQKLTFADMENSVDCFEALWTCERGLTGGRSIGGTLCYCPQEHISRAEFLVMAMELSNVKPDDSLTVSVFNDTQSLPAWQQGYLAAAMQRGVIRGEVSDAGLCFRPNDPITDLEAAAILQNLYALPVPAAATETDAPAWAADALNALSAAGIPLSGNGEPMTRIEAARLFYSLSRQK